MPTSENQPKSLKSDFRIAQTKPPLVEHLTDVPRERRATAPYNFVPLPDRVVTIPTQTLPPLNTFADDFYSGSVTCELETETPLYTRSAYDPNLFFEAQKQEEKIQHTSEYPKDPSQRLRNNPEFFNHGEKEVPWIPGSSIRGMLRSLVRVVAQGHLGNINHEKLAFRAVADNETSIGLAYRGIMKKPNLRAGYLRRADGEWKIAPASIIVGDSGFGLVPKDSAEEFSARPDAKRWKETFLHAFEVCYEIERERKRLLRLVREYGQAGVLVITGGMENKTHHYVFGKPDENKPALPLSAPLIEGFNAQLTKFQEQRIGKPGHVLEDTPVFYLVDAGGKVRAFGWTLMFRLPYGNDFSGRSPADFALQPYCPPDHVDLAQALFGFVQEPGRAPSSRASRVRVGSAKYISRQANLWLENKNYIVPRIIGQPKPSCFQQYLAQTDSDPRRLRHYGDDGRTVIRGFKHYWHRHGFETSQVKESDEQKIAQSPSQYTCMKPVDRGVRFQFKVWFENLHDYELGALLWALKPVAESEDWDNPEKAEFRQKLGMAKPLGLGSVRISPKLVLDDRRSRYEKLFEGDDWYQPPRKPEGPKTGADFIGKLDATLQQILGLTDSTFAQPRIQELLAMLEWEGLTEGESRYLEIERPDPSSRSGKKNEYKERPVLPLPSQVRRESSVPRTRTPLLPPSRPHKPPTPAGPAAVSSREGSKLPSASSPKKTALGALSPATKRTEREERSAGKPVVAATSVPPKPTPSAEPKRPPTEPAAPSAPPAPPTPRYKKKEWIVVKVVEKRENAWVLEHPAFPNGRLKIPVNSWHHPSEPDAQGQIKVRVKDLSPDGKVIREIQWW